MKVIQDPNAEVEPEVLAAAIERIAKAMDVLTASRLKFDTIVLLVSQSARLGQGVTRDVLIAARDLAKTYLKPPAGKK